MLFLKKMFPVLLTREFWFPDPSSADSQGLLAIGGDLTPERLLLAYSSGIFPWYSKGQPLLWWSPDPRMVLFPEELHVPRRLRRIIRRQKFVITFDRAFRQVIEACATARNRSTTGTWITPDMMQAYLHLHQAGYVHSVEAWRDGRLAGGLYGLALGGIFFGESMFFNEPDASKCAFVFLVRWLREMGAGLIDCQVTTSHLARFGAREISREDFLYHLERLKFARCLPHGPWQSPS